MFNAAVFVCLLLVASHSQVKGFGLSCFRNLNDHTGTIQGGSQYMPNNLKVAMIGDNNNEVLELVLRENAEIVIHAGDFDYHDDADDFFDEIESVLPDDFPYFLSMGNHDVDAWDDYHERAMERYERTGSDANCRGAVGVDHICSYKGLLILSSAVGTCSYSATQHINYVDDQFSTFGSMWKIVNWHKNQRLYQLCTKSDETGYGILDASRQHGAIVMTAHEHSYARTYEMSHFQDFEYDDSKFNPTLRSGNDGTSFLFVSGLGGESIRDNCDDLEESPWWASTAAGNGCTGYCRNNGGANRDVQDGAFFCTFKYNGQPNQALCYFKDTTGYVFDSFMVYSNVSDAPTARSNLTCAMPFLEFTSQSSEDDHFLSMKKFKTTDTEILTLDSNNDVFLTVRNVELEQNAKIVHSSVQVYSAAAGQGLPDITVSAMHNNALAQTTVKWTVESEDWERHTVWNTNDLTPLIREITSKPTWQKGDDITFVLSSVGSENRQFYSIDHGKWFAPTLAVELASPCDQ